MIIYATDRQIGALKEAGVLVRRSYYASKWCGRVPHYRCEARASLEKLKQVLHPNPVKTEVRGKRYWCFTTGEKVSAVPQGLRLVAVEYEGGQPDNDASVNENEVAIQVRSRSVETSSSLTGSQRPTFHYSNFKMRPSKHGARRALNVYFTFEHERTGSCGRSLNSEYAKDTFAEIKDKGGVVLALVKLRTLDELVPEVKAFVLATKQTRKSGKRRLYLALICAKGAPRGTGQLLLRTLHFYAQSRGYRGVSLHAADDEGDDTLQKYYDAAGYDLTGKYEDDMPHMRRSIVPSNETKKRKRRHTRFEA